MMVGIRISAFLGHLVWRLRMMLRVGYRASAIKIPPVTATKTLESSQPFAGMVRASSDHDSAINQFEALATVPSSISLPELAEIGKSTENTSVITDDMEISKESSVIEAVNDNATDHVSELSEEQGSPLISSPVSMDEAQPDEGNEVAMPASFAERIALLRQAEDLSSSELIESQSDVPPEVQRLEHEAAQLVEEMQQLDASTAQTELDKEPVNPQDLIMPVQTESRNNWLFLLVAVVIIVVSVGSFFV